MKLWKWLRPPEIHKPTVEIRSVGTLIMQQNGGQIQVHDDVPIELVRGLGYLTEENMVLLMEHRKSNGINNRSMYVCPPIKTVH